MDKKGGYRCELKCRSPRIKKLEALLEKARTRATDAGRRDEYEEELASRRGAPLSRFKTFRDAADEVKRTQAKKQKWCRPQYQV